MTKINRFIHNITVHIGPSYYVMQINEHENNFTDMPDPEHASPSQLHPQKNSRYSIHPDTDTYRSYILPCWNHKQATKKAMTERKQKRKRKEK